MKKTIWITLVTLALLQINPLAVQAGRGGHGGYRGNHGYRGHGGYKGYRGYRGHGGHYGVQLWLGPGLFGPYYPYYPYYSYYPYYPYYPSPPVVIQQQPQEYIVKPVPQQTEQAYWYYCQDPEGYYPYVQRCSSGWTKVLPTPPSADMEVR